MRYSLLFSFFYISLSITVFAQDAAPSIWERSTRWERLDFVDGGFRLMSPGQLEEQIDTISVPVGEVVYHTYYLTAPTDTADNVMYMVSYCDYPEATLHSDSVDLLTEFFEVTIDEAAKAVRGELRFATDFKQQGHPGKYWRIDYLNGQASIRTRAFVVGSRFYSIQTISRSELGINPSTDRFLDGFQLY